MYYEDGNAAAGVAYPRMQLDYKADLERLINSTSNCAASLLSVNPPAYENIINGNTNAIDSYNPLLIHIIQGHTQEMLRKETPIIYQITVQ